jgi:hypothetical protein
MPLLSFELSNFSTVPTWLAPVPMLHLRLLEIIIAPASVAVLLAVTAAVLAAIGRSQLSSIPVALSLFAAYVSWDMYCCERIELESTVAALTKLALEKIFQNWSKTKTPVTENVLCVEMLNDPLLTYSLQDIIRFSQVLFPIVKGALVSSFYQTHVLTSLAADGSLQWEWIYPSEERVKGITYRVQSICSVSTAQGALERLERLETPAWRDAVQAALFRYLMSHDTRLDLLDTAVQVLQRCEHAERMAILGLAVWKAMCLLQVPEKVNYYSLHEWPRLGWKECKAEQRNSRAMTIISESVSPFLEAFES